MRDQLFATEAPVADFVFDKQVVDVFDDMIERSVPLYVEVQRMVVELTLRFLGGAGTVCDVGCSTGRLFERIWAATAEADRRGLRFVGIEPSRAMRERALGRLRSAGVGAPTDILDREVQDIDELPDARVVTMLYTLQFVRPIHRHRVLRMLHDSLVPGGCLLVAEKILADEPDLRRLFIELHHDYKQRHGYSALEIARKREALENVLVPFTDAENRTQLHEAGFTTVEPAFRWYNFALYIAVKDGGRPRLPLA